MHLNIDINKMQKFTPRRLISLRNDLGINQTEFAKLLGFTHKSQISKLESGARRIPKNLAMLLNLIEKEVK